MKAEKGARSVGERGEAFAFLCFCKKKTVCSSHGELQLNFVIDNGILLGFGFLGNR
jgi:hypothetical protein